MADFFCLDKRSLGLMRICVGLTAFFDVLHRLLFDLGPFYTDAGFIPRTHVQWDVMTWPVMPHFWFGSAGPVALVFIIHLCALLLLILGWKTRWVGPIALWLTMSMELRTPTLLQGGDQLIVAALLWGLFLPWGKAFTVETGFSEDANPSQPFSGWASLGFILQIGLVYFVAATLKTGPQWREDFTAIQASLLASHFTSSLGTQLAGLSTLWKILTPPTLLLELLALPAFFIPWKNFLIRKLAVGSLILFHVSHLLLLDIGFFPFISISCLVGLIPPSHWPPVETIKESLYTRILVGILLPILLWQNLLTAGILNHIPPLLGRILWSLVLDQRWQLFAPDAGTNVWWVSFEHYNRKGDRQSFWTNGEENAALPSPASKSFSSFRWTKFYANALTSRNQFIVSRLLEQECTKPDKPVRVELWTHHIMLAKDMSLGQHYPRFFQQLNCPGI